MKRREFIQLGAGGLLAAGLWPGRVMAEPSLKNGPSWRFIAVNDLHFLEPACRPWFDTVVAAMKRETPDAEFCLICGDLADGGTAAQLEDARDAFKALGMPVYATPGNHDCGPGEDRSAYERIFAGHVNQSFEHRGWQFIGLDSAQGTKYQNIAIQPATFQWLDAELPKLEKKKPTVIFTHFPLGEGVHYRPTNADALLERFLDFNLHDVLNGHWHGFTEKTWQHATVTTNRCCSRVRNNHDGTKEKGWFVCEVADGRLTRRFVEIPQI
jgi:3',5'-cyclic AMP phosphodiesterase CpdA